VTEENQEGRFKRFYLEFFSRAVDFAAYFVRDESAARDVVNDVFLAIWENDQVAFDSSSKSYLFRAVKNRSINYLKKQGRMVDERSADEPHVNTTEELQDFQEAAQKVKKAIDQLPSRCRQVFLLKRYSGLSNQEVADLLSISHKTVENQMTRALKHLKNKLL
jgi:RNA polymerase sigma-70 factor (ECF subfamily)